MSSKKKRRKKLKKQMKKRGLKGSLAVVICVGKKCCDRKLSKAVVQAARESAEGLDVRVERVGCLHVCKKGPIVATYPDLEFRKRVEPDEVREVIGVLGSHSNHPDEARRTR